MPDRATRVLLTVMHCNPVRSHAVHWPYRLERGVQEENRPTWQPLSIPPTRAIAVCCHDAKAKAVALLTAPGVETNGLTEPGSAIARKPTSAYIVAIPSVGGGPYERA